MSCDGCQPGYTIEDLYDLVFPADRGVNGYLCMVYNCFLDDSKDANQSQMFVSAGFFGTRDDWSSLRRAWGVVLRDKGIEYFKSSEYNHLTDQFAKYRTSAYPPPSGRDAAKEIKTKLQQVVRNHSAISGIGICVLVQDYEKVSARPEADGIFGKNPYHRALESVMFETVKIIRNRLGHNMVAFVHDDGDDFGELHSLYKGFQKMNPKTAKYMGGFQSLSDKEHAPLQMADMIANSTLEFGLDSLANGGVIDLSKLSMKENIRHIGLWNEDYMLSVLKRNLMVKGRPIPLDLQSDEIG